MLTGLPGRAAARDRRCLSRLPLAPSARRERRSPRSVIETGRGEGQEITTVQLSTTLSLAGRRMDAFQEHGPPYRSATRIVIRTRRHTASIQRPVRIDGSRSPRPNEGEWRALRDRRSADATSRRTTARFGSLEARKANEDALDAILREWTDVDRRCGTKSSECASGRRRTRGIARRELLQEMMERDPLLRSHYQIVHQPVASRGRGPDRSRGGPIPRPRARPASARPAWANTPSRSPRSDSASKPRKSTRPCWRKGSSNSCSRRTDPRSQPRARRRPYHRRPRS